MSKRASKKRVVQHKVTNHVTRVTHVTHVHPEPEFEPAQTTTKSWRLSLDFSNVQLIILGVIAVLYILNLFLPEVQN